MIETMVSSTVNDLLPDREAVVAVLDSIPIVSVVGAKPVFQPPIARSPYVATVEMAETCHLYLLLLGSRYGFAAQDDKSATELEFDAAYKADPTKILVFKKKVKRTEKKQKDLIERVGNYHSGYWITAYSTTDDLADLVLRAFERWIEERAAIGSKLDYFDHFLRMSIQRSPIPGAQPSYAVSDDYIELKYVVFGNIHVIHFSKSEIYDDFWGCIAKLDAAFAQWLR